MKHKEDVRNRQAEIELMERRRNATLLMEESPTLVQLYLHVADLSKGGILFDREGFEVQGVDDL